jgi:hypothetical protein
MSRPAGTNPYMVLRILVFAFAGQIILLNVIVSPGLAQAPQPNLAFVAIGTLSILTGILLSQSRLAPIARLDETLPAPAQYQVMLLIPLAFMELGAMLGVFAVGHQATSYVMSGVAVLGMLVLVYPHVERYCRAAAEQGTK